jgi:glycosyltransferase involved in cell wall biosynthesis
MRIALLAHQYFNWTGVGVYTRELVRHLPLVGQDAEYVLLYPGPARADGIPAVSSRVTTHGLPDRRLLFPAWHLTGAPALERLVPDFDLVHVLAPAVRVPTRKPAVVTVLDLAPRHLPWAYSLRARRFMARGLADFRRADSHVVAISETVRADVVATLGFPPDRVTTTRLGVDTARFRRVTDPHQLRVVRERYGLPARFFLFVGAITPRKNLGLLLDAYGRLAGRIADPPGLVVAGPGRPDGDPAFARRWRRAACRQRIRVVPPVEPEDLATVYSAAEALVYPSLHEGFGLPVLEAMACDLPVVCTRTTALPEVAADAAVYVSGHDAEELADALARLHGDAALRERCVAAGRERVAAFSWLRCAAQTYAVYQAALQGARRSPASPRV